MTIESIAYLRPENIQPSPYQHRRAFGETDLKELARSIESDGLIQPITVRPVNAHFELIAGERRWRAVKEFTALPTIAARILAVSDSQARRLCAIENLQRSDLSAVEEVAALADIVDTELLDEFGADYINYGARSADRVRFVLMKLAADKAHGTEYFVNKFINKVRAVFSALPKPKEWQSFLNNDLPLITSIDEDVQEVAVNAKLNKSQTKALQKLKDADKKSFAAAAQRDDGLIRHVYHNINEYDADTEPDEPESLRDLSAERIAKAAKTITRERELDIRPFEPPQPKSQCIDVDALWIWGRVGEIHDFVQQGHSFESLFRKMTPTMQGKIKRQAAVVADHISQFGAFHE
jgi:hypothetical protein